MSDNCNTPQVQQAAELQDELPHCAVGRIQDDAVPRLHARYNPCPCCHAMPVLHDVLLQCLLASTMQSIKFTSALYTGCKYQAASTAALMGPVVKGQGDGST